MSPADKLLLLRALAVLAWVRWTLAKRGFAPVKARAFAATAGHRHTASKGRCELEEARQAASLLRAAQHALPGRNTCLHVAAALKVLLAERGIASDLRFGMRKELGKFAAHAWLECAGRVLIGGADVYERYVVFAAVKGGESDA